MLAILMMVLAWRNGGRWEVVTRGCLRKVLAILWWAFELSFIYYEVYYHVY
jgi:hypothetical protein